MAAGHRVHVPGAGDVALAGTARADPTWNMPPVAPWVSESVSQ